MKKGVDISTPIAYNIIKERQTNKGEMKMKKLGKALEYTMAVASIALVVWIGASWFDVITDNSTSAEHASWNAFSLLVEMAEEK
jgi:hypothetical protein